MSSVTITTHSEAETAALGRALAERLHDGATIALEGTLGAGKTRLVQAVATALGVQAGAVLSPTFVLVQEYRGKRHIYHIDAYRIADDDEFLALGAEEMLSSEALVFIEWASRVARSLPPDRLQIEIADCGETARRFTISATDQRFDPVVDSLRTWQAAVAR